MKIFHFCANHTNIIIDPNMPVPEYLKTYYQAARAIVTTKLNSYFSGFGLNPFITNRIDNLSGLLAEAENFPETRHDIAEIVDKNIRMADEIAADLKNAG